MRRSSYRYLPTLGGLSRCCGVGPRARARALIRRRALGKAFADRPRKVGAAGRHPGARGDVAAPSKLCKGQARVDLPPLVAQLVEVAVREDAPVEGVTR